MYNKNAILILWLILIGVVFVFYLCFYVFDLKIVAFLITIIVALIASVFFVKIKSKQSERYLIHSIAIKIKTLLSKSVNYNANVHSFQELLDLINLLENEILKEREHFKNLDSYRKEYLGNVSHELKTPLFNVQGYISTLLDGAMEDKHILKEYLKKADKNIERMINIIDDLETISQLESGAMILDYEVFDIETLIQEVFEQLELQAKTKGIQLKLVKHEFNHTYFVNADKFRIRQVFINLISNSIKYGKENGITTVLLNKKENKVLVSVQDNGIGIEEKHLPRIFERFYRVDKGRSREQGGTGLGLAIVKHIIDAHKQSISVQSKINEGTTFTFSLELK
ncbi:MAG: two-component sensor histidine kinase [Bacteroidia bacterium]|nr:MAG: two-component sensor histidine kinase [Bacteroidia bacterium]